jgi:hypothetical protein
VERSACRLRTCVTWTGDEGVEVVEVVVVVGRK